MFRNKILLCITLLTTLVLGETIFSETIWVPAGTTYQPPEGGTLVISEEYGSNNDGVGSWIANSGATITVNPNDIVIDVANGSAKMDLPFEPRAVDYVIDVGLKEWTTTGGTAAWNAKWWINSHSGMMNRWIAKYKDIVGQLSGNVIPFGQSFGYVMRFTATAWDCNSPTLVTSLGNSCQEGSAWGGDPIDSLILCAASTGNSSNNIAWIKVYTGITTTDSPLLPCATFFNLDMNKECDVHMGDSPILAKEGYNCSDPDNSNCVQYTHDMQIVMDRLRNEAMHGFESAEGQVVDLISKMNTNGSFNDIMYPPGINQVARDIATHSLRLQILSQAYLWDDPSNSYYQNMSLKDKICDGWNYLAYNAPDNNASSWWWKKIGAPCTMWKGLVLAHGELDSTIVIPIILNKYFENTKVWWLGNQHDNNAGGNLTDRAVAGLAEGVLMNTPSRITEIVNTVDKELIYYDGYYGSGLQPDYSMHQHPIVAGTSNPMLRSQLYGGGYGIGYADGLANLLVLLKDSSFAFSEKSVDQVLHYILEGQQWFMRGKTFEPTSTGRGIALKGVVISECGKAMRAVAEKLLIIGKRSDELQKYIARIDNSGPTEVNFLHGNRAFWTSDTIAHHRKKFMVVVRMLSERTLRPETTKLQNKKGYYMGDGFTTIMTDGDEYGSQTSQEIFPVWDWERLPGTTVEHTGNVPFESFNVCQPENNPNLFHHVGNTNFVGSVSDGEYGMAMMDYGRATVSVTAKKSWFFFDNELVALGADIDAPNAGENNPVYTSVNQVLLNGDVIVCKDNGTEQILSSGITLEVVNPRWVFHDGIGYVFLGNSMVTVQAQRQTGNWKDISDASGYCEHEVFSVWINHGARPSKSTYAYVVVPGISKMDLVEYYNNLPITILSNTGNVQAVRHNYKKNTQASFYQLGSLQVTEELAVEVDAPAAIMLEEGSQVFDVTASNPQQLPLMLHVNVNLHIYGQDVKQIEEGLSQITFNLPTGRYAGSSQHNSFQIITQADRF